MATALPFSVVPFENKSGTVSFRVTGSWGRERIRKNFPDRVSAENLCNAKNAEAMKAQAAAPMVMVQTRLSEADVRTAEGAVNRISGRWPLLAVIEAGIAHLESRPVGQKVAPLGEEWLTILEDEVSDRWRADLRKCVRRFTRENPDLMTDRWDRAFTRTWLDGLDLGKQTKANLRNGLHRFGGWLVESGHMAVNPAAGIRITGRMSGAKLADRPLPSIFTPRQAEALLRACELGACRRLLGWVSTCLFTGLRPESEAPRSTWAEVKFETGEFSVMGRKRGAKPRVVPMQPTAVAWLKVVKADAMDAPAVFSRRIRARAVELANAWLAEHHPKEKPIAWDEDIARHTFASYRSPQVPIHKLAEEMGTSASMIYAHYRNPRPAAEVAAFWSIMPA